MTTTINLNGDDLRIIGHSINWQLNGQFQHTLAPQLSEDDTTALTTLFNDLCRLNRMSYSAGKAAVVEIGEPYSCADGSMRLPPSNFRLMTDAVASFWGELNSSPAEIEVLTGLPPFKTNELLTRLEGISQSVLSPK